MLNSVTDPWVMLALVSLCHILSKSAFPIFLNALAFARFCSTFVHAAANAEKYDGVTVAFTVVAFSTAASMSLRGSVQGGKLLHASAQP